MDVQPSQPPRRALYEVPDLSPEDRAAIQAASETPDLANEIALLRARIALSARNRNPTPADSHLLAKLLDVLKGLVAVQSRVSPDADLIAAADQLRRELIAEPAELTPS